MVEPITHGTVSRHPIENINAPETARWRMPYMASAINRKTVKIDSQRLGVEKYSQLTRKNLLAGVQLMLKEMGVQFILPKLTTHIHPLTALSSHYDFYDIHILRKRSHPYEADASAGNNNPLARVHS